MSFGHPSIKILQFNTQRSKTKVLVPLLAKNEAKEWDLILIQEPWRNPYGSGTYCPRAAGFTQVIAEDTGERPSRACILVNNRFGPDQWQLVHREPDLVAIRLRKQGDSQQDHMLVVSVYNPSPLSRTDPEPQNSVIPTLIELLSTTVDTARFIAGDFNLHHPLWEPLGNRTEAAATTAENALRTAGLRLITTPGTVTSRGHNSESTIDLAWCDPQTERRVIRHHPREDLQFGSDHIPLLTSFLDTAVKRTERKRLAWGKVDTNL